MKKGWELKKLKEIAEYTIGLTYSPKHVSSSGVIVLRSSNIQNDLLDLNDLVRVNCPIKQSLFLRDGDILMCSRNGSKRLVGKTAIIQGLEEEMTFGTFMTIIRSPHNTFLSWFFKSDNFRNQIGIGESTMINQVTKYMLDEVVVPVPTRAEQIRIVALLDEAFGAIDKAKANLKKNLQNAKDLFESYLEGVFERKGDGWEEKKLAEVCEIKPPKKEAKDKLGDNDLVSFLPMEDLGVCENKIKASKERILKDVVGSYTYFAENDVLLAKITPCFENGKLGVAKNLTNGIGFGSSEYIVFRCPDNIYPEFLFYFLSRESLREEGKKYMSGAVGHKRVSKDWIENYNFFFPKSIKEQKNIVSQLDALQAETKKLEIIYQKKVDDLDNLKKSILQKAFSGEL